jgi:hypothetical protein
VESCKTDRAIVAYTAVCTARAPLSSRYVACWAHVCVSVFFFNAGLRILGQHVTACWLSSLTNSAGKPVIVAVSSQNVQHGQANDSLHLNR